MNPSFWKNKRVFVTGHTGFKGSWMTLWLQSLGAQVTGYALDPLTSPNMFEEAKVGQGITSIIGDVRDFTTLHQALRESAPEIVFHMAAQPLVRYSYENPIETYSTNVMGTVNILEVIKTVSSVEVFVNITTDKVYENKEWEWAYRENEGLGGNDPYSSSKACSELVTSAYHASFFSSQGNRKVSIATARAGNVIGGGDWSKDRLVPDIIRSILSIEPIQIRNPDSIRPWQHVLEPIRGYLTLAEKLYCEGEKYNGAWNFGPNELDARPVKWIVDNLIDFFGYEKGWVMQSGNHPHEANYLKLDISKAHAKLNWHPLLSLNEGLKLVGEWAQKYQNGENIRNVTLDMIHKYQSQLENKI